MKLAIVWRLPYPMMFEKSCRRCREVWSMHHRCPALGGRWDCC